MEKLNSKEMMRYKAKAKDSFRTLLNMFLFDCVINRREDFDSDQFINFKIDSNLIRLYTNEYWQFKKEHPIKDLEIFKIELAFNAIKSKNKILIRELQTRYINEIFPTRFTEDEFSQLLKNTSCYYCNLTEEKIELLGVNRLLNKKSFRGWSLEIDRLDSNLEYSTLNCVMCCYWCNNAKTDEFTEAEFRQVGKSFEAIWDRRLALINKI